MHYAGELAAIQIGNYEIQEKDLKREVEGKSKEVTEKLELLRESDENFQNEKEENKRLRKELEEKLESLRVKDEMLAEEKQQKKELQRQLDLSNKSLPSLPKKQNRFQRLGTKVKVKIQQLAEKIKQNQESFAQIEVRVN